MKKELFTKNLLPLAGAILIFLVIVMTYFNPLIEGKRLQQDDISRHRAMSKEIFDFREQYHQEPLWTNSMFGGMPAYQISTLYPGNLMVYLDKVLQLGLPNPANYVFLYALGFFILLLSMRINPWLSAAGSIGYAFSSYFFIILVAGHNSKAHAIGYFAPVIAGVLMAYRGKYLAGGLLTLVFLSLEIACNHLQITYYLALTLLIIILAIGIEAVREKQLSRFLKASATLAAAAILATGPSIGNLWTTWEYSKDTIRGKSELTSNQENKTSGLDKDYATQWSYGVSESFSLLIPNFKGGSSQQALSEKSAVYQALNTNQVPNAREIIQSMPTYWGDQPFTSGPVYVGAIFVFLFVLGLFIVPGPLKWGLFAATLLSLMLAWGHNFNALTEFFLDYFPAYNKFRAVAMILVIAQFTIPFLGILALQKLFSGEKDQKSLWNGLKWSVIITAGLCLIFALLPGAFFDFTSKGDEQLKSAGYPDWLIAALITDRESLLRSDAFRSLIFIVLSGAVLWAVLFKKIKSIYGIIALFVLILIDMWPVNHRYLNKDNFVSKSKMEVPFQPSPADELILKDKDPNFRVLNTMVNPFADASTSYFHKSVGGYHGAKLRRYQDLIDFQINKNNMAVLNMLNTKYFIVKGENNVPTPQINMNALGNAWFVRDIKLVPNADAEIQALDSLDPKTTAIVDQRFKDLVKPPVSFDTTAQIVLKSYKPNDLVYESSNNAEGVAIFSEIFYAKGWNAYIDGKEVPHFRANYVLRGMMVPAGKHEIRFRFEPESYQKGEKISYATSILIYLLIAGFAVFQWRTVRTKE